MLKKYTDVTPWQNIMTNYVNTIITVQY